MKKNQLRRVEVFECHMYFFGRIKSIKVHNEGTLGNAAMKTFCRFFPNKLFWLRLIKGSVYEDGR